MIHWISFVRQNLQSGLFSVGSRVDDYFTLNSSFLHKVDVTPSEGRFLAIGEQREELGAFEAGEVIEHRMGDRRELGELRDTHGPACADAMGWPQRIHCDFVHGRGLWGIPTLGGRDGFRHSRGNGRPRVFRDLRVGELADGGPSRALVACQG